MAIQDWLQKYNLMGSFESNPIQIQTEVPITQSINAYDPNTILKKQNDLNNQLAQFGVAQNNQQSANAAMMNNNTLWNNELARRFSNPNSDPSKTGLSREAFMAQFGQHTTPLSLGNTNPNQQAYDVMNTPNQQALTQQMQQRAKEHIASIDLNTRKTKFGNM